MDARRFDLIARGVAENGTRRSLIRSLAVVVAGTVTTRRIVRADGEPAGTGGSDGATVCPPSRRPARKVTGVAPFPTFVVGGVCDDLDESTSYNLIDAGSDESDDDPQGAGTAVRVARSMTSIRVRLDDLISDPHSIIIRAGGSTKELIACGEIGGVLTNNSLAFGLKEQNGSGYAGIAQLKGADSQTSIEVLLAQDLFELVDSWDGAVVVTTIDVNLRKKPSEDADVITVLGEGTVLTVTGPEEGEWIPVENQATGDTGYVNIAYVEIQ
jgi:Bacterial SH3 domain